MVTKLRIPQCRRIAHHQRSVILRKTSLKGRGYILKHELLRVYQMPIATNMFLTSDQHQIWRGRQGDLAELLKLTLSALVIPLCLN